jgi:hypothetical protein
VITSERFGRDYLHKLAASILGVGAIALGSDGSVEEECRKAQNFATDKLLELVEQVAALNRCRRDIKALADDMRSALDALPEHLFYEKVEYLHDALMVALEERAAKDV